MYGKIKKLSVFLFCLIILLVSFGFIFSVSAVDYENHWARPVFDEWIRLGILKPDANGNIHPDNPVSKGELCSYINKIMGYVIPADISKYTDTSSTSRYYWDMAVALNAGYIEPTSANTLSHTTLMTREQVISMFVKVAKITPDPADMGILSWVRDVSQITTANLNLVASSIANGFIAGRDNYELSPKDYMTVSEAIVLLDRLNSGKRIYAFPGVYGPLAGNVISNYTTVISSGVNLNNANIAKDLDIHSNAGDGDVYFNNDNIIGKFLINGAKNIYISTVTAGEIEINKKGAHLIYVADQNSDINTLVINSDNVIVDINKGNKTKKIIINGNNVTVNAGANVKIDELTVNGGNAAVNLSAGARIETVTLNGKTQIKGQGTVGTLNVNHGGDGSVIEPKPDKTNIAEDTSVIIDNKEAGATNPKIIAGSFLFPVTVKVNTEDTSAYTITKNDFKIDTDGTANNNFTITKVSATEFNIILPVQISVSTRVTITGVNNLHGTVTISQDSQPTITEAVPSDMKTLQIALTNPQNKAFSNENFQVQIAGKAVTGFLVTAQAPTLYNLTISTAVKSGQVITITGQNGLGGSVTVGAVATVKSIIFEDDTRFLVNTDDTSGNKIIKDCFEITVGGNIVTDYTITEKSKTSFEITLTSKMTEGTSVSVKGKKYLGGQTYSYYAAPFGVSKVNVTDKKNITIVLASAPTIELSAEKHADAFQVFIDDTRIPVTAIKKDPADKKGATFNLTVDMANMQGILTVNRIKESKNKGMVDYVAPVLAAVRMNDKYLNENPPSFRVEPPAAKLIIEFSEPVFKTAPSSKFTNKDIALSGAAFNIITATGSGFDPNGVKVTISANSIIIDLSGAKRMDPGIYTLTIDKTMIFDSFGNACSKNRDDRVSYKFDIIGSVPTVTSAKQTETGNIEIKLNGTAAEAFGTAMASDAKGKIAVMDGPDQIGKDITYHYISYDSKAKTLTINRDSLAPYPGSGTLDCLDKDTYKLIFTHPDFIYFEVSKVKLDTKKPQLLKVTLKENQLIKDNMGTDENPLPKVTKSNAVLQIEFSEPVYAKPPSTKFSASNLDLYGQAFNIDADDSDNVNLQNAKITANNKIVTVSLSGATALNPDRYLLKIDSTLIYDSVGNPVDWTDNSMFRYYFKVIRMPPNITYAVQQSNGDIYIRFSRYSSIAKDYRNDMYESGLFRILDLEGNEIQLIYDPKYIEMNETTGTLIIKRSGLDPNIKKAYYVIELINSDYETGVTPQLQIYTSERDEPTITIGGSKKIPMTANAEQTRITSEDAIINVVFSGNVKRLDKANFSINDFVVTTVYDPSIAPFTLYIEDSNGVPISLDMSKVTLKHSGTSISIDLSKAVNDSMVYAKFTFTVNEALILDVNNIRISNEVDNRRFKLAKVPFPLKSAEQKEDSGDVVAELKISGNPTLEESNNANDYGNYIDGTSNDTGTVMSTVRFERNGIIVGYIPSEYIVSGVTYELVGKTITIQKSALDKLIDPDGKPVQLDGGNYTLVLTHSAYADNRIDNVKIDTTPPSVVTGYPKTIMNSSGTKVTITFKFNEDVKVTNCSVMNNAVQITSTVTPASGTYGTSVKISFDLGAINTLPSLVDYKINLTVQDKFANITNLQNISAVPLEPHSKDKLTVGANQIPGFEYNTYALSAEEGYQFLFEPASDYLTYYDINRKVIDTDLINRLNGIKATSSSDTVTLKSEMTVGIPSGAISYRYTKSKVLSFSAINISGSKTNVDGSSTITLYNNIDFVYDNATNEWTVNIPAETSAYGYYIFEWTTADKVYYTYVISDFDGSTQPTPQVP